MGHRDDQTGTGISEEGGGIDRADREAVEPGGEQGHGPARSRADTDRGHGGLHGVGCLLYSAGQGGGERRHRELQTAVRGGAQRRAEQCVERGDRRNRRSIAKS